MFGVLFSLLGLMTMIISAWWFRTSSKFSGKKSKEITGKLGNGQLLKRVRIRP